MEKIKELVKGATEMAAAIDKKNSKKNEKVDVDKLVDEVIDGANVSENKPDEKSEVKAATDSAKVKIIIAKLPDTVTPKVLSELFQLNDSGKTVRRHLRKSFGDNHDAQADWKWDKNDPVLKSIVTYFAERYNPVVKEEKKVEAK
jgi:hypothetical protein